MPHILTSACAQFDHPEFCISFEGGSVLAEDVQYFSEILISMVSNGKRFLNGQSLQVGWSFALIERLQNGMLGFKEADFVNMPLAWQSGLGKSLRHMRLHKEVLESVLPKNLLTIPSFRGTCIICTRLRPDTSILIDRQPPENDNSGWFFGCLDKDHDHSDVSALKKVSLYEAVICHAPAILPYLALPSGCMAVINENQPILTYLGEEISIIKGSYLDAICSKRQAGNSI